MTKQKFDSFPRDQYLYYTVINEIYFAVYRFKKEDLERYDEGYILSYKTSKSKKYFESSKTFGDGAVLKLDYVYEDLSVPKKKIIDHCFKVGKFKFILMSKW